MNDTSADREIILIAGPENPKRRQSPELNGMTRGDVPADIPVLTPSGPLPSLATAGRVLSW